MNCKNLSYGEPENLLPSEVDRLLVSEIDEEVERALLSLVFHESNADRVLEKLFALARSNRPAVRGTAILCLGHAARIQGVIPLHPTVEIVNMALEDEDDYVRGHANSAAEDIKMFVPEVGEKIRDSGG